MASSDQSFLRFGPLRYTGGWDLTVGPGVQPATCTVTFTTEALASLTSPVNDLVFLQGSREIFRVKDCHVVRASGHSLKSKMVRCTIMDWRWRWQYGYINGSYNIRESKEQGSSSTEWKREKTPQELATLLLEALGEKNFDVKSLPNDTRPTVNWQGARADSELTRLCSSLGCYPAPDYKQDRVVIHKMGDGSPPNIQSGVIQEVRTMGVRPLPGTIRVVGGPSLFQTRLRLEAVGVDTDGSVKPLEEISYLKDRSGAGLDKDTTNWDKEIPGVFANIHGTYEKDGKELQIRDLAADTVYKMYRVAGQAGGESWSPEALRGTEFEPEGLDDLLPIRGNKVTTHKGPKGGDVENPATVHGEFAQVKLDYANSYPGAQWPAGGFSIDNASGIVSFQEPAFKFDKVLNKFTPANLELDTSYPVNKEGVYVRYEEFKENKDEQAFGDFHHPVPDIVAKISEVKDDELDNREEISSDGKLYLEDIARQYAPVKTQEFTLTRIQPIPLSGIVRQITWSGGGGRPSTTVFSINGEHNNYIPRYESQVHKQMTEDAARKLSKVPDDFLLGAGAIT
tara:strand:+ start:30592 stop:32292 length:1701 start_codon:yes stop_codon:yes gene_type:complete